VPRRWGVSASFMGRQEPTSPPVSYRKKLSSAARFNINESIRNLEKPAGTKRHLKSQKQCRLHTRKAYALVIIERELVNSIYDVIEI